MTDREVVAVIPARYASTRFPGKPLAMIAGKPMIVRVYERTIKARLVHRVVVAVDDDRIEDCCRQHRIPVFRSQRDHNTGTERVIEAFKAVGGSICVNVQGDEPLIEAASIDAAVRPLLKRTKMDPAIVTLRRKIEHLDDLLNPNVVKVVCDHHGRALYFSRLPIPSVFEAGTLNKKPGMDHITAVSFFRHIGLYAYHRDFIDIYDTLRSSMLETSEKLEQLKFIENGFSITCVEVDTDSYGVDRPEDIERVEAIISRGGLEES